MTKLDKEIQEGLYDPKKAGKGKGKGKDIYDPKKAGENKGKLTISGKKPALQRLKKHLEKEHPSTKGKMKVNAPMAKTDIYAPHGQKQSIVSEAQRGAMFAEIDRRTFAKEKKERRGWDRQLREKFHRPRVHDPKKPSGWFDAMVRGIKRSSDVRNPWAIVKRIWDGLSPEKKKDILRREAAGERFNYDLPLPDDRDTKGTGTLRMVKPFKLAEAQVNVSKKDMAAVKKSGIFESMAREDGSTCMVARCKSRTPVNIFVDELR